MDDKEQAKFSKLRVRNYSISSLKKLFYSDDWGPVTQLNATTLHFWKHAFPMANHLIFFSERLPISNQIYFVNNNISQLLAKLVILILYNPLPKKRYRSK